MKLKSCTKPRQNAGLTRYYHNYVTKLYKIRNFVLYGRIAALPNDVVLCMEYEYVLY